MDQLQAHGALFAHAGLDHGIVEREYRDRMDELLVRLETHLPIDPGHDLALIEDREGLVDLLTRLSPFSAEFAERQEADEIRKNLWHLAYGDEG